MSVGPTQRRVVLALLITGLVPLVSAMVLATTIVNRVALTAFQPEFGGQLERSLETYADLVKALKRAMKSDTKLFAQDPDLRRAVAADDRAAMTASLEALREGVDGVITLRVQTLEGDVWAEARRPRLVDEANERPVTIRHPLTARALDDDREEPLLVAVFAADQRRFFQLEASQEFVQEWKALAERHRDRWLVRPYLAAFAVLFGTTVLIAIVLGALLVRPTVRRIQELAAATVPVAEGDLSVRVDEEGEDELAELARSFNRMLADLAHSQARVAFLKRVAEWQTMARRLAHEIKNPLTPIQLAVEECHGRYTGDDRTYRGLLDTTLDIVSEEIEGLRHLVGEFSSFARLPRAELEELDLARYLDEQRPRLEKSIDGGTVLEVDVEDAEMATGLDRTLFFRVLKNLVENGAQAAAKGAGSPRVRLSARPARDRISLAVEDNGPGIEEKDRPRVFDPSFTTKAEGTGLGLTIVKKLVLDHRGT
ncbi:MAG: ATP-binding protein, partial [Myxococcota bacterium]